MWTMEDQAGAVRRKDKRGRERGREGGREGGKERETESRRCRTESSSAAGTWGTWGQMM